MQKQFLLIGNGINFCGTTNDFLSEAIAHRFGEVIQKRISNNDDKEFAYFDGINKELEFEGYENNIERLAYVVYEFVCTKYKKYEKKDLSKNDEMKFISLIKNMAINTIFFRDNKFIENEIPEELVRKICLYENVLTLNYFEYWDKKSICIHLHGKIRRPFYSELTRAETEELTFSPAFNNITKTDILNMGRYPSDRLYPSEDLYPTEPKKLYKELDNIQRIEVFGISPYGDDELIEKLNMIEKVKIFIYNSKKNDDETDEWKKRVSSAEIVDASDF